MGCETLLFNISLDAIALMPCDPAIGGLAKGHLRKEVDTMGGEMGKIADLTANHSHRINASKGPAVPVDTGAVRQAALPSGDEGRY